MFTHKLVHMVITSTVQMAPEAPKDMAIRPLRILNAWLQ